MIAARLFLLLRLVRDEMTAGTCDLSPRRSFALSVFLSVTCVLDGLSADIRGPVSAFATTLVVSLSPADRFFTLTVETSLSR
jgi:hypothetical protein